MEKAFVLDIGSVSVRLLVGERVGQGNTVILGDTGIVTNLQAGLKPHIGIDDQLAEKTFDAVGKLLSNLGVVKPDKGAVICTQSVRQAANAEWFLANLERIVGIKPEVLSRMREGRLALKGSGNLMKENDLLIDFGGGSTEIIYMGSAGNPIVYSFPIGAGRFLPVDRTRIRTGDIKFGSVLHMAEQQWASLLCEPDIFGRGHGVVLGGTMASLVAIYRGDTIFRSEAIHGKRFCLEELGYVIQALSMLTDEETGWLWGIETGRESIILNGGVHLVSLCNLLGVHHVTFSEQGIRFGRLFELLHQAL